MPGFYSDLTEGGAENIVSSNYINQYFNVKIYNCIAGQHNYASFNMLKSHDFVSVKALYNKFSYIILAMTNHDISSISANMTFILKVIQQ